jgi:hypothetical protein
MWVILYRTDDVPPFIVNETGYVVVGKARRDPALQTAVAKQVEEDQGKERRSSAFQNENKDKKKGDEDRQ